MFERTFTEAELQYITKCRNCGRDEYHHILFFEPGRNTHICEYCLPEINRFEEQEFLNRLQNDPDSIFKEFIPPAYLKVSPAKFQSPDPQLVNKILNAAIKNESLAILGNNNTGKTTLLWITFKHLVTYKKYHPRSIRFEKVNSLRTEFTQGVQENFVFDSEKYKLAKLLLLDDLTAVNLTPAFAAWLFGILDYRCEFKKPTFVTTDSTFDELIKFDKRIAARVERFEHIFDTGAKN